MDPLHRLYLKYSVQLIFGLGGIVLAWNATGILAFAAGFGGMLLIIFSLWQLALVAEVRTVLKHPEYKEPLQNQSRSEKIVHYGSIGLLIFTIYIGFAFAERLLENNINGLIFLAFSVVAGMLAAGLAMLSLKMAMPFYFRNNEKRAAAAIGLFISVTFWTVIAAFLYNKQTAAGSKYLKKAYVASKTQSVSPRTLYLTLKIDGKEERFRPSKKEWEVITEKDTTTLLLGRGKLGFEYIFSFDYPPCW